MNRMNINNYKKEEIKGLVYNKDQLFGSQGAIDDKTVAKITDVQQRRIKQLAIKKERFDEVMSKPTLDIYELSQNTAAYSEDMEH